MLEVVVTSITGIEEVSLIAVPGKVRSERANKLNHTMSSIISLGFSLLMIDDWSVVETVEMGEGKNSTLPVYDGYGSEGIIIEDPSVGLISSVITSSVRALCFPKSGIDIHIIKADGGDLCKDVMGLHYVEPFQGDKMMNILTTDIGVKTFRRFGVGLGDDELLFENAATMGKNSTLIFHWKEWRISFPVLTIGNDYEQRAFFHAIKQGMRINGDIIWNYAVSFLEEDAQTALNALIGSKELDEMLQEDGNKNILACSVIGLEDYTFSETIYSQVLSPATLGYTEPLHPALFHATRVAGILLLCITLLYIAGIMYFAKMRNRRGVCANPSTSISNMSEGGPM